MSDDRDVSDKDVKDEVFPFRLYIVPVTPFEQNCSIVVANATNTAAVVDPGGDLAKIEAAIAQSGAKIEKILLTHGHIDHAGAAGELAEKLAVPIEGPHVADGFLLAELPATSRNFGLRRGRSIPIAILPRR